MKNFLKLFAIALVIVMSSCEKEILPTDLLVQEETSNMSKSSFYSELGVAHNGYLDDVAKLSSFPNHSYKDLYCLSETYFPEIHSDKDLINCGVTSYSNYNTWLGKVDGLKDYAEVINFAQNNSSIYSQSYYDELMRLNKIINSQSTLENLAENNLRGVLDELNIYYNDIPNNTSLSKEEIAGLRQNIEITYYSMMYWYEVALNEKHPWHTATFGDAKALPDWLKKAGKIAIKVSLDAAGFTVGFALGSALGATGGPIASVAAGTACGTLLGTGGSSLIK